MSSTFVTPEAIHIGSAHFAVNSDGMLSLYHKGHTVATLKEEEIDAIREALYCFSVRGEFMEEGILLSRETS